MALLYIEEQKKPIALVRDVAEHEIKPFVQEADEKSECLRELLDWGLKIGLHMLKIPAQYGETGLSYETMATIFEELAKVDTGYTITFVTTPVALRNVILAGTPEQAQYFADIIDRGSFAGLTLTEPDAGSDPTGTRGTAVADGDEYVLNATKTFITNGALSDIYADFFKADPEAGHKGISAFIIDKGMLGVSVSAHKSKMGFRLSNTTGLIFEDMRVPKNRMLGPEGSGFKLALDALNFSRTFVATLVVGIMQRALDEAVKYTEKRKQLNTLIIKFQMVQALLADMTIKVGVSRYPVDNTMKLMDVGNLVQKESSITKTFVTDCTQKVTSNAVQVSGGYGYSREYPVEKLTRGVKAFQIFERINQIQRMTVANVLNKEYR